MRVLALASRQDLERQLARVGADECSWSIFAAKHESRAIAFEGLSTATANILKQSALALGADCAVHRAVASGRVRRSDAVLFVNRRQLAGLVLRLREQPDCVARLAPEIEALEHRYRAPDHTIRIGRRRVDLGSRTHVMGILNVTPDSFYDGGRYADAERAAARAQTMEQEGADFVDIGGESTRPGAEPVSPREQLRRVLPVLRRARREVAVPLSIDTTSARVAEAAIAEGAAMVNDISGLSFDRGMARVVARAGVPCVVMHTSGRPRSMQQRTTYRDLLAEVVDSLRAAVERGLEAGVRPGQLIVDPGIGFGKTAVQNLEILRRLGELRSLGRPILVGPSRKSFIGRTLGTGVDARLEGSLAACVVAAQNGANVLRVHDVLAARRALALSDAIAGKG